MTLLLEFLLEIVASIFVEGAYEATFSKRIPLWIRIILLLILALFFGTILFGLIALGIFLLLNKMFIEGALFTALGVALILGLRRKLINDFKNKDFL